MHGIDLLLTIASSLGIALVLGYITHRLGMSPIVGYLLAGIAVGPYTPGLVADVTVATQLAEVGVVLLMFGVGLQFHWKDLLAVKAIAVPGAVGQSLAATALGVAVAMAFGWGFAAGLVLGIAMSVASTVVLIRVLSDNDVLATPSGHAAVGWLVVEDIFTVIVLILLPASVGATQAAGEGGQSVALALAWAIGKLAILVAIVALVGARVVPWLMERVARSRSRELFTLTVLVVALGIAAGSAWLFGASMALGAFLAGMAVSQSKVSYQAASDALPMRDAFAVLFFVSVGMLFDPLFLLQRPGLILAALAIILLAKPLAAVLIVVLLGYSVRTALTVAVGLAQIGEFSFILSELGRSLGVLPQDGHNVLVAGALLSISLNPLLFRQVGRMEAWLQSHPRLWSVLQSRFRHRNGVSDQPPTYEVSKVTAVVVGFGPVGQTLTRILCDVGLRPTVIDLNIETVKRLAAEGTNAIYGDASREDILLAAGIAHSQYLVVTLPDRASRLPIIHMAKRINPAICILIRARYISERQALEAAGVHGVAYEEADVAVTLADLLLRDIGLAEDRITIETDRVRNELSVRPARPQPKNRN